MRAFASRLPLVPTCLVKSSPRVIPQFEQSPLTTTGVLVRTIRDQTYREAEHPVGLPHRDAHYLLLLATEGDFTLSLDFEEMAMAAPALAVVFPGQVHHFSAGQGLGGWIVSFDPALLDGEIRQVLEEGFRVPYPLDRQSAFYAQATALLPVLARQPEGGLPTTYAARTTQALLTALLSLVAGQLLAAAPTPPTRQRRGPWLERAFRQLLKQHYQTWKQPARYAAELAVSVAHLNDTVKGLTGTPVSGHIQRQSVLEAKRLLCFTDLSVKEIGYAVGYEEPVYFSRLFRKVAGCPPLHFRQKFRA